MKLGTAASFLVAIGSLALPSIGQAQRVPYGPGVTLEQARKAATAAQAEQKKMNMPVGVAIDRS